MVIFLILQALNVELEKTPTKKWKKYYFCVDFQARPICLGKYYQILKDNSNFFVIEKKNQNKPAQRNKIFLLFAGKNFTLQQTFPPPKAMSYCLINPLS